MSDRDLHALINSVSPPRDLLQAIPLPAALSDIATSEAARIARVCREAAKPIDLVSPRDEGLRFEVLAMIG